MKTFDMPAWLIGGLIGIIYFVVTFLIEFTLRCNFVWEFSGHCGELYSPFAWLNFPASISMLFVPYLLKFGTFTQVIAYYLFFNAVLGVIVGLLYKKFLKVQRFKS